MDTTPTTRADNGGSAAGLVAVALVMEDSYEIFVWDVDGQVQSFGYSNKKKAKQGVFQIQDLCFSCHGLDADDLLTPCLDEEGHHGTPDEGCFCGEDTPHLHAHVYDPATCGDDDNNGTTCTTSRTKSAASTVEATLMKLARVTLLPTTTTTTTSGSGDSTALLRIPPSKEHFPQVCSSDLLQSDDKASNKNMNTLQILASVTHGDHTDQLIHNQATGRVYVKHDACSDPDADTATDTCNNNTKGNQDCCHGVFGVDEERIWDGEDDQVTLRFYRVATLRGDSGVTSKDWMDPIITRKTRRIEPAAAAAAVTPKASSVGIISSGTPSSKSSSCCSNKEKSCCGTTPKEPCEAGESLSSSSNSTKTTKKSCCDGGTCSAEQPSKPTTTSCCSKEKKLCCDDSKTAATKACASSSAVETNSCCNPGSSACCDNPTDGGGEGSCCPKSSSTGCCAAGAVPVEEEWAKNLPSSSNNNETSKNAPKRSTFFVKEICCASEVAAIRSIVGPLEGVESIKVNVTSKMLYVNHDVDRIGAADICDVLNKEMFGAQIEHDGALESNVVSSFVTSILALEGSDTPPADNDTLVDFFATYDSTVVQNAVVDVHGKRITVTHNALLMPADDIVKALSETLGIDGSVLRDGKESLVWEFPDAFDEEPKEDIAKESSHAGLRPTVIISGLLWLISMLSFIGGNWYVTYPCMIQHY
jgi:copper chaperone CopZ